MCVLNVKLKATRSATTCMLLFVLFLGSMSDTARAARKINAYPNHSSINNYNNNNTTDNLNININKHIRNNDLNAIMDASAGPSNSDVKCGMDSHNRAKSDLLVGSGTDGVTSIVLPHDTYPGYNIRVVRRKKKTSPAAPQSSHYNQPSRDVTGGNEAAARTRSKTCLGDLSYRLLETGFSKYFTMIGDGFVMTTTNLAPLINQSVHLKVLEETPNSSRVHQLKLYVLNRKDILKFATIPPETVGEVAENRPIGSRVFGVPQILARSENENDNDGQRKTITYRILDGDQEAFALLNSETMTVSRSVTVDRADEKSVLQLVTNKVLDREAISQYRVLIEAQEESESTPTSSSSPINRALATVMVHVLDENDNRPVFVDPQYKFQVVGQWMHDDASVNQSKVFWPRFKRIGVIEATDADHDKVTYKLLTPNNYVIIVPQTGELLLVGDPPFALSDSQAAADESNRSRVVELQVEAHDLRVPSLAAKRPAKVLVEFMNPEVMASVFEREVVGKHNNYEDHHHHHREKRRVTRAVRPTKRIEFTESDGGQEGKNVFQLEKETDKETFKIRDENPWVTVETNGAVRVKKKWDYEELGPEKTIDFWVIITNSGHIGNVLNRTLSYVQKSNPVCPLC